MKKYIMILGFMLFAVLGAQTTMPSYWNTYPEIVDIMEDLAANNSDIMQLVQIGTTNGAPYLDPIPIWAMKISDNVETDEDEPALLFVGQCHAEELTGMELTLRIIQAFAEGRGGSPFSRWIETFEIWFVPTMNPEGVHAVMELGDYSFRKNMRDNNEDGMFDFAVGIGNDIDGVDLNRNYGFNWVHGYKFMDSSGTEPYDYYRGPAPFSEGGNIAIRDLAAQQHFIYSINWHDSRQGGLSEKVFYPYQWKLKQGRENPDWLICKEIGEKVAENIRTLSGETTYMPGPSSGRNGTSTPWFYQEHGTIQLTIEVSSNQPDSSTVQTIIGKCWQGMIWLITRAENGMTEISDGGSPMLTGHITDAVTGDPLVAEIIVEEHKADFFTPRLSDELYGRFWRPLQQGTYNITVRKKGYAEHHQSVVVNNSGWTTTDITLQPLGRATYNGTLTGNNVGLDGKIILTDVQNDTIEVTNGTFTLNTYEGEHRIIVTADGHYPYDAVFTAAPGTHGLQISLDPETVVFAENWENGADNWTITGPWTVIEAEMDNGSKFITDSWADSCDAFYAPNCDVNIATNSPIAFPANSNIHFSMNQRLYTEPEFDSVYVQLSANNTDWTTVYQHDGIYDFWHEVHLDLSQYAGGSYYLRFRLTSESPDPVLVDPGWSIDDIKIVSGDAQITEAKGTTKAPALPTVLKQNYPNPFNPVTTLSYSIAQKDVKDAHINIYNVKGELIQKIKLTPKDIDNKSIVWNASDCSSGIYFYRLSVNGKNYQTRKACLIK